LTHLQILITEGPLKGHHAVLLAPVQPFRFMALPSELRSLIHGYLLQEDKPIQIISKGSPRRPVRGTDFMKSRCISRPGISIERNRSNAALLQVSKAILSEAAPTLYGNNTFDFGSREDCHVFLDTIDRMKVLVRHIQFAVLQPTERKLAVTSRKVKDVRSLQSLTFKHDSVCGRGANAITPESIVEGCKSMLERLRKARPADSDVRGMLELLRIGCHLCWDCQHNKDHSEDKKFTQRECAPYTRGCGTKCGDLEAHCKLLDRKLQMTVSETLGIEVPEAEG
jgi:hypothetical protein